MAMIGDVPACPGLVAPDGPRASRPLSSGICTSLRNQVESASFRSIDGTTSRSGDYDLVPLLFEQANGNSLIDDIVLGEEDCEGPTGFDEVSVSG